MNDLTPKLDSICKEILIKKYGRKCMKTYKVCEVDVHHIYGKKRNPHLRFELDNMVLLSRQEHRIAHNQPSIFMEWFTFNHYEKYLKITELKRENKVHQDLELLLIDLQKQLEELK